MPYAQVEFNVPQEARIIGAADLEIRNLLRPEPPAVPKEFAKRWRPEVLSDAPSQLGPLLRQARLRMGLSFRAASAISREIANLLDDLRYFTAPGSLSDYESGNIPPRHIHKIITFCVVYSLDLQTVLQTLGLSPQDAGHEPIPQVLTGGPLSAASETALETDETEQAGFLGKLLAEIGEIPFFLRGALPVLSGLAKSVVERLLLDRRRARISPLSGGRDTGRCESAKEEAKRLRLETDVAATAVCRSQARRNLLVRVLQPGEQQLGYSYLPRRSASARAIPKSRCGGRWKDCRGRSKALITRPFKAIGISFGSGV